MMAKTLPSLEREVLLTSGSTSANFDPMFTIGVKNSNGTSRLISAALLLFVFFLPFHVHFSSQAHVTKECGCVHGTRTQLAPPVDIALSIPVFQTDGPIAQETFGGAAEWPDLRDARAPPSALSV